MSCLNHISKSKPSMIVKDDQESPYCHIFNKKIPVEVLNGDTELHLPVESKGLETFNATVGILFNAFGLSMFKYTEHHYYVRNVSKRFQYFAFLDEQFRIVPKEDIEAVNHLIYIDNIKHRVLFSPVMLKMKEQGLKLFILESEHQELWGDHDIKNFSKMNCIKEKVALVKLVAFFR